MLNTMRALKPTALATCRRVAAAVMITLGLCTAPAVLAIGEVDIVHDETEQPGVWVFCKADADATEPFRAEASGLLDANNDGDVPDAVIDWTLTVNGTGHPFATHDGGRYITFSLPTNTAGEYAIEATATNAEDANDTATDADTMYVVEIESLLVRRKGSGASYSDSATIGAGGIDSDVHKADVKLTVTPAPTVTTWSVDIPLSLSGTQGENTDGIFTLNGTPVTTSVTVSSVTTTGTYVSCDKTIDATISSSAGSTGTVSATITQGWNYDVIRSDRWSYPSTFEYDTYESISYFLELEDSVGIDGHNMRFVATEVIYDQLDLSTWTFQSHTVTANLAAFTFFSDTGTADGGATVTTDSSGQAQVYQYVHGLPNDDWTIWVTEVSFDVVDEDAYE